MVVAARIASGTAARSVLLGLGVSKGTSMSLWVGGKSDSSAFGWEPRYTNAAMLADPSAILAITMIGFILFSPCRGRETADITEVTNHQVHGNL